MLVKLNEDLVSPCRGGGRNGHPHGLPPQVRECGRARGHRLSPRRSGALLRRVLQRRESFGLRKPIGANVELRVSERRRS